jgi:hypothetical protein
LAELLDISNLVFFLIPNESRYIIGQQIRVDAGALLKFTRRTDER